MSYLINATKNTSAGRHLAPDGRRADRGAKDKVHSWTEIVPDRDSAERRCLELIETDRATGATFEEVTEAALIRGGLLALWDAQHGGEA